MLFRLPKMGDLLRSLKQWYWYEEMPATDLSAGYVYAPYIPVQVTSVVLGPAPAVSQGVKTRYGKRLNRSLYGSLSVTGGSSNMPMDAGLLVIDFDGLTLKFYHDDKVFSVTAECIEHIMNDFDLVSDIEGAHE